MSSHWTSSPVFSERSVRESNPVFLLTTRVCCRNTYRPFSFTSDPPAGLEPARFACHESVFALGPRDQSSDRGWSRTRKSSGSERRRAASVADRSASLRTRPCCWWRVRELHPTSEAHEASRSAGSTRELQAPESNRVTDRMKVSSVPTGLHHHVSREERKHEGLSFAALPMRVPRRRLTWSSSPLRSRTLHP